MQKGAKTLAGGGVLAALIFAGTAFGNMSPETAEALAAPLGLFAIAFMMVGMFAALAWADRGGSDKR